MSYYLSGLALGLGLIVPIGVQNLFVLKLGLAAGFRHVLVAIAGTAASDTALIAAGTLGASALLGNVPSLRAALIAVGVALLLVLAITSLRARPVEAAAVYAVASSRVIALQAIAVSVLNPHAVLDTLGVIGGAVAAQEPSRRFLFAAGAISASWLWFAVLGGGASLLQARLTPRVRLWIERCSGAVMLVFAALLLAELVRVSA